MYCIHCKASMKFPTAKAFKNEDNFIGYICSKHCAHSYLNSHDYDHCITFDKEWSKHVISTEKYCGDNNDFIKNEVDQVN